MARTGDENPTRTWSSFDYLFDASNVTSTSRRPKLRLTTALLCSPSRLHIDACSTACLMHTIGCRYKSMRRYRPITVFQGHSFYNLISTHRRMLDSLPIAYDWLQIQVDETLPSDCRFLRARPSAYFDIGHWHRGRTNG